MKFISIILVIFLVKASISVQIISKHAESKIDTPQRSFRIDPVSGSFLKDDMPFRYISGAIHYFRVHPNDWRDRLQKLKFAGFDTVETYVEWSSHEPEPGVYNFEGGLDLLSFLSIAQEEGLNVILRPGPYICAERDFGGLPYWLLRENPDMELRRMDSSYISYVDSWFNVLFPLLKPYLYVNGGPVITVQIENEYGFYSACDYYYTSHLKDIAKELLGDDVTLFTTDGGSTGSLSCGKIADVYATVDFGPTDDVESPFEAQRIFEPNGPLVNSEFYPGWLDHWGDPHSTRDTQGVVDTLDRILALNASVNMYMFIGGTNFGLSAGANTGSRFQPDPTSYDYDAPLTEAGDPTEKYYAIRNVTQKYVTLPSGPVPGPSAKYAYGDVLLTSTADVFGLLDVLDTVTNETPQTFEALSVVNGIVVYSTSIPYQIPDPARLSVQDIHDRGYVYVDNEFAGIVSREQGLYDLQIYGKESQTLTIVAESQGRVGFGEDLKDFKGITTDVTIGDNVLSNWDMTPLPLLNSSKLNEAIRTLQSKPHQNLRQTTSGDMTFYEGTFNIPTNSSELADTFLRLDGWTKGFAWINDFLVGRYWPVVGPQVTLYIPRHLLQYEDNTILLLELEKSPCGESDSCKVSLVDTPEIDGPTPQW